MEDKIKLFLQYMKKEKELQISWDKEDGIDVDAEGYRPELLCVDRVKSFISYRNIRVEEAWYSKLNNGNSSREVREKVVEYDATRSRRHALALNSMIGLNMFGERYGLPKFYDGELLEPKDIDNYKNISTRKKETDFFFGFIDTLSRTPMIKMEEYFSEVGIDKEAKDEKSFIKELQSNVESTDRAYGVTSPILSDDDDIKFKDEGRYM